MQVDRRGNWRRGHGGAAALVMALQVWLAGYASAQDAAAGWAPSTSAPAASAGAGAARGAAALPGVFDTVVTPVTGGEERRRPRPMTGTRSAAAAKDDGAKLEAQAAEAAAPPPAVTVRRAVLEGDGARTRFVLSLSKGVRSEIFTLSSPYRVVIDIPDTGFALADGTGRTGAGLVTAFRYGLFAERKARVVLDVAGPVRIDAARMTPGQGEAVELIVELVPISAEAFGAGTGVGLAASGATQPPASAEAPRARQSAKPVVVIDPGHGGIDPGAIGATNLLEKTVVLEIALKLKRRLDATGRYDVRMTRQGDVFVSLDNRVRLSREAGADLFISLHADSIASRAYAATVRGATVYTLSDQASDEQARAMAEKENASDLLAGIDAAAVQGGDVVRDILIDLMKRETANYSAAFSSILTGSMRKSVAMARDPQRSAAFKVLRQPHAPSVLVELGYMSNEADESLMRQAEWQAKIVQAIGAAVASFFDRRTATGN